ncbi:Mini-ribonuclease 3 [Vallitalea guaymasensis]|uniref:Mini-ribonuclease 3 n=1 Tax=Vallitalea guaymasensis TaxID=1185412 RepID=UPI00272CD701|nr:ribonuclease III domain-containing protein [Vallitalea guaymasensis]
MQDFIDYFKDSLDIKDVNPKQYSPLVLAYIGDSVYDLIIKSKVIAEGNSPVNRLHKKTSNYVKASAQAKMFREIEDMLTEEEFNIYKRGRNAKSGTVPKNADLIDYRVATGFEALIGFLYLDNRFKRIIELIVRGVK